jgi:hypothetical protein
MTQALYAHVNNKTIKQNKNKLPLGCIIKQRAEIHF